MSTNTLQDRLVEIIETLLDARDDADDPAAECADLANIAAVCTFEDRGLMTRDSGLVIEMEDGSEFQLTIVRSR